MPYLFDFNEIISFDTEIMEIYRKCDEIMEKFPKIRQCVDFDLDRHALKKKELRLSVKKENYVIFTSKRRKFPSKFSFAKDKF